VDDRGGLLSGSVPLRVRVTDPLGAVRYDLYRAADRGTFRMSLPLAVNDPAGAWQVRVTELLNNGEDTATFRLEKVTTCGAAAGRTGRAMFLGQDRDNVYRFFRTHHRVTIVKGGGSHNTAAAERLTKVLGPWNVRASIVSAAEVNHPRALTAEQAKTWVGLQPSRAQPGDKNPLEVVGFAVEGPVILLGTPEDNPLIAFLQKNQFLPYTPNKDTLPGPGRGLVAWQLDGIGVNQESLTLIAYDAQGMEEAVGTTFEMMAGIERLFRLAPPRRSEITAAVKGPAVPEAVRAWSAVVPDRVVGLRGEGGKLSVLTHAGTLAEVQDGKVTGQRRLDGGGYAKAAGEMGTTSPAAALAEAQKKAGPAHHVKFVAAGPKGTAVVYWGGTVNLFDPSGRLQAVTRLPQDVTAVAWAGDRLVVGDADGRLVALGVK
jgi:hypothetical protein